LALVGASAGGHLASLASLTPQKGSPDNRDPLRQVDTTVAAVVAFFPPADFLQWGDITVTAKSRPIVINMVQRMAWPDQKNPPSDEEFVEALRSVSPVHQVTDTAPPFLLIHGDADPLVPLQQSEALKAALEAAGVPVELIIKEGGGHPWPTIHEEVAVATDWLDKTLATEK
jgi:acetyl esterase/lipase